VRQTLPLVARISLEDYAGDEVSHGSAEKKLSMNTPETSTAEPLAPLTGPAIASREAVALLRLLTSASLMRLTIKERATFLTKTTDWERLEDAMRSAEKVLGDYTQNVPVSDGATKTL